MTSCLPQLGIVEGLQLSAGLLLVLREGTEPHKLC
jgi:hypothetical protein